MSLFDQRGEPSEPLVVIRHAGDPVGKGDPKSRIVRPADGKMFVMHYTDPDERSYADGLRASAIDAMRGKETLDGPLELLVFAFYPVPKSWTQAEKDMASVDVRRPTVKPDWDNVGKILDALNPYRDEKTGIRVPIVWRDDACVVDGRVVKLYAKKVSGLVIEVRRAGPAPLPWTGLSTGTPKI